MPTKYYFRPLSSRTTEIGSAAMALIPMPVPPSGPAAAAVFQCLDAAFTIVMSLAAMVPGRCPLRWMAPTRFFGFAPSPRRRARPWLGHGIGRNNPPVGPRVAARMSARVRGRGRGPGWPRAGGARDSGNKMSGPIFQIWKIRCHATADDNDMAEEVHWLATIIWRRRGGRRAGRVDSEGG